MFCGFVACNDDDIKFDVPVEFQKITFEPRPGGALMRYKLPDNLDVFGVRARYTSAFGEEVIKDGSYITDSLLISGFTEARAGVPVSLSFFNSDMVESAPIEMTFDTEPSATVALFDSLTVNPFWGGFNVTYRTPKTVDGMVHVFYIGTDPRTQRPDSILMGSYPIMEGGDTLNFEIQQMVEQLNVVVRTDDYSGHRVKKEVYEDIPALVMDTLTPADFDFFSYPEDLILEMPEYGFSKSYLFDGKKRGDGYHSYLLRGEHDIFNTFVAGPNAFNESGGRFIIDLRRPRVPAGVYIYAWLNLGNLYYRDGFLGNVWGTGGGYFTRVPIQIKVYGVKVGANPNTVSLSDCALLYELEEEVDYSVCSETSWCKNTAGFYNGPSYEKTSEEAFAAVPPIQLRMMCNYTGEEFQHLILVVDDTPSTMNYYNAEQNPNEYVTFDELEVVVQAEVE